MKRFLTFVFLFAWATIVSAQIDRSSAVRRTAELFVAAYNARDWVRVEKEFNFQMRAAITSEQFAGFMSGTAGEYGKIVELGSTQSLDSMTAIFPVAFERGKLDLLLALDGDGRIAGLRLTPPRTPRPQQTVTRNRTKLGLPFRGEWLIFWGGDTPEQNQHQNAPNQRFAFDIIKLNEEGISHRGRGTRNEDYYAFGQEIIAPADGVVTDVVNGVRDNTPGVRNEMFVPGNTVVIKHADGEHSLFAHLKLDSVRVKVGDRVTHGQVIALCGNSGNSSEPHLHYQLQKTPLFTDGGSIKVFFDKINVRREGKSEIEVDHSPIKGSLVSAN